MPHGRRKHSASFKVRVALEAVKGEETVAQLALCIGLFLPVRMNKFQVCQADNCRGD